MTTSGRNRVRHVNPFQGIRCPDCGSEASCIQTCRADNTRVRRRKCEQGHIFFTLEEVCSVVKYNEWRATCYAAGNAGKKGQMAESGKVLRLW